MPDPDQLPPTRTSLLQIQRELSDARQGHDMLERKREVLLRELWGLLHEVEHSEQEVQERFRTAYAALRKARLSMGTEGVRWAGLAPAARSSYDIQLRSIMGVALPIVTLKIDPLPLPYSLWGISATFDEARERWLEVGKLIGNWAEVLGAVWRVAAELERTQRRVNALENLLIPQHERAIERIETVLEEQERESFIRSKRVKKRKEDEHA